MTERLWTPADVAAYLGVSKRTVAERYAARPDFPSAIRLPSDSGHGLMRWKAGDVMRWVERQK
jgi:predicted DNA-binding transcriptional regulator AlpA